jgi:protease YdgD
MADYVDDWAIIKLDRPLGKKYGVIPLKSVPSFDLVGDTQKFALVVILVIFLTPSKRNIKNLQLEKA